MSTAEPRVLLFSPLQGLDPPSGDISYTEALLAHPPPGVTYTTYQRAMEDGSVVVRGRRPGHGRSETVDQVLFGARAIEFGLRKTGVMFREPTWYISIRPGVFDLLHQHLFAIRQIGLKIPVVSSAGYPLDVLYRARERWSRPRLRIARSLEALYCRLADIHNPWLRPTTDGIMTVYSEHFRSELVRAGISPTQIRLASTALPDMGLEPRTDHALTLGFVGRDFVSKGGDLALAAFRILRSDHPSLRMLLVTSHESARRHQLAGDGIEVILDPSRTELTSGFLPRIAALLAPTRADCGAPYALLEALQLGIPIITTDLPWLDDRLIPPAVTRAGLTSASIASTAEALLEPTRLAEARSAARELWEQEFSMPGLHRRLIDSYNAALDHAEAAADDSKGSPSAVSRR